MVDLRRRAQRLIDVARLVNKIEHHAVFDRFAELVGVDVAAKDPQARRLVLREKRRAGEADEYRVGHHRLHHAVQLAALRAMALVHENEYLAHGRARLRLQLFDEGIEIVNVLTTEFVYECSR